MRYLFLAALVGCAGLSNKELERTAYLKVSNIKKLEELKVLPWEGNICEEKGEIIGCGKSDWQRGIPIKGTVRLACADVEGKAIDFAVEYENPIIKDYQVGFLLKNCGNNGNVRLIARYKEFEAQEGWDDLPILPGRGKDLAEITRTGIILSSSDPSKYISVYENTLKARVGNQITSKDEVISKQRDAQLLASIKANWVQKKHQGQVAYLSKTDGLTVTGFLGMMNWIDAFANCKQRGMRLPTLDEGLNLYANGICPIALQCGIPFWTVTSRSNDGDATRNMIIGSGEAWGVIHGQGIPSKIRDELGAVCVNKP